MIRRPPRSTLFPCTTLCRSRPEDFRRIIHLMEAGRIDTTPWITHRASFDDTVREFPSWVRPETGVIKIGRHTSELQSRQYLVCRLLLEKKKICPVHLVPMLG